CYLERLKAVMRDLKAINWGPTDESVRKVIWHTTEAAATKWTMFLSHSLTGEIINVTTFSFTYRNNRNN
ncbi:hypothetical protein ACUNZS_003738, partial [Escherichia coli]